MVEFIWGHTKKYGMTVIHLASGISSASLCGLANTETKKFVKSRALPKSRIKCNRCFDTIRHRYKWI